jgi:hypothetical protein
LAWSLQCVSPVNALDRSMRRCTWCRTTWALAVVLCPARGRHRNRDLDTVVQDLLTGQCKGPDRIAAFNTVDRYEGRHRDIQLPPPMRLV